MGENLQRFFVYTLITSTGSFDTGRAITTAVAIVVVGPAVLTTLRRAARRATVVGVVVSGGGDMKKVAVMATFTSSDELRERSSSTPTCGAPGSSGLTCPAW